VYENSVHPVDYRADIRYENPPRKAEWRTLRVNEPWDMAWTSFILHRYGFSPRFQVWDEAGRLVFDQYVNLRVAGNQRDSFDVPELGLSFDLAFYPDFAADENGRPASRTPQLKNPAFHARVNRGGETLYEGFLRQGKEISFSRPGGEGALRTAFTDVRYWVSVRVVREIGLLVIFLSFFGGSAALAVRHFDYERRLWIESRGDSLRLRGFSPHCPALFEEEAQDMLASLNDKKENTHS